MVAPRRWVVSRAAPGRRRAVSMRSKRRLFCTLLAVSAAFMSGLAIAAAQGIPAPSAN